MSKTDEIELIMKHIIRQIMKDQFNEQTEDKQENNNSFIYLEKSTLNMLIMYMLMNGERRPDKEAKGDSDVKILEELEQAIMANKEDFEEIITLLKERI